MGELGVALIGAGEMGALRAQAIARTPGLRLLMVADVRQEVAGAVSRRFGSQGTTDWQAAASDSRVAIVVVSTPPDRHTAAALASIDAGKHVLCEKPLAHTLEDARAMCEAAERRGVFLKTGFNHRYFPAVTRARELVSRGSIGEVRAVRAYAGHGGGHEFGHPWVHDPGVTGGGSLVDNGLHILDLTRFFLGDVETAAGAIGNLVWPFEGAEDNAFALFRARDGRMASVQASWTDWRGYRFWVETVGTRGYVRVFYPPMLLEWGTFGAAGQRVRRRRRWFPVFQVLERLRSWRWTVVTTLIRELEDFATGIRTRQPVPATGRDGLRALEMAHAVYRSSREGREVPV